MNKEVIIVEYDPFARESRIGVLKGGHKEYTQVLSSIEDMTDKILSLAYERKIYEVKIHGPFNIVAEIEKNISQAEAELYSNNKITIGEI